MKKIEWYQYDDLTLDWASKRATIEALREIAEQLNKLNQVLSNIAKEITLIRR